MDKKEKILLLESIMKDIRGDWGENLENRIEEALGLSIELDLSGTQGLLLDYQDECEYDTDGRFLRCNYEEYGGYIGMEKLHGLTNTIIDKSDEFKSEIFILNNPEFSFDDWEDWDGKY